MVADALRELELAATELASSGPAGRGAAGAAQDRRAPPGQRRLAHPAGGDGVADRRRSTRRSTSCGRPADQLKLQGRADEYVRVAERLLFHRPDNFSVARELAAAYIARRNPRLALAKLQARAQGGAARSAERHAARRGARAARSVEGDLGLARAGRDSRRRRAAERARRRVRAALALDPTDGETRELAGRWGIATLSAVRRARHAAAAAAAGDAASARPAPGGASGSAAATGRGRGRSGLRPRDLGALRDLGRLGPHRPRRSPTSRASCRRPTCS